MAASRKHSCGSLVGSGPLHACCITSYFHRGKGMNFDVKSLAVPSPNLVNSSQTYLRLSTKRGFSGYINLRVEIPRHVRIPKSQCILAASLFFGLLKSHAYEYETPDGTDDEVEEEGPSRWDGEWKRSACSAGSSYSSYFTVSIFTDYLVTAIRGDGRSLFRSIVYGISSKEQKNNPDTLLSMAGALRKMAVDGLDRSQTMVEWFIEGDFGEYVRRMALEETLGGEVEISMVSSAIMRPIRVFRHDKDLGGLVIIAQYGMMYADEPIDILYKGDSPDDAFEVPGWTRRTARHVMADNFFHLPDYKKFHYGSQ